MCYLFDIQRLLDISFWISHILTLEQDTVEENKSNCPTTENLKGGFSNFSNGKRPKVANFTQIIGSIRFKKIYNRFIDYNVFLMHSLITEI